MLLGTLPSGVTSLASSAIASIPTLQNLINTCIGIILTGYQIVVGGR